MTTALQRALNIEKACEELGPYPAKGWIEKLRNVSKKYGIRPAALQKIKGWGYYPLD